MNPLDLPGSLKSLAALRHYVQVAAQHAGLDWRATYKLCLAVDEIATNAVKYGRGHPEHEIAFTIRGDLDQHRLCITLEDSGTPYDPRQTPTPTNLDLPLDQRSPGGLGVFLAMRGVDEFHYERIGERNHNHFVVRRSASHGR